MNAVPIWIHLRVDNIVTYLSEPGAAYPNPQMYLWSVFFKIDGTLAHVHLSKTGWNLQGSAFVTTPGGGHGDLPGGVQASYEQLEKTPVPFSLGNYVTTLAPFPVPAFSGVTVGGMIVGWLGVLLYQEQTQDNVVAAGLQSLRSGVLVELDELIPTITNNNQTISPDNLSNAESQVTSQIEHAMENAASLGERIEYILGDTSEDTFAGYALQQFTYGDLMSAPPQGIPIRATITSGGTLDPHLYEFTFNGTVVAAPLPFSLRLILTSLGYAPPVSVRSVVGTPPSLLAWIEAM